MTKKVLITDKISDKTKRLTRHYVTSKAEVVFSDEVENTKEHIASADILVTSTKGISKELLNEARNCIYIQKFGVGVNNIAIPEATERGIPVGNVGGVNALSVAEYAVMLMLSVIKHITTAHNKLTNEGLWLKTVLRDNCYELSHKKVGLIGLGNIGRKVVSLLKGFECEILYYDIFRLPEKQEKEMGVTFTDLVSLIKKADIISLHAPLTEETKHIINYERLKSMKPTAILINTSRGGLVDENALISILESGHLLGAGIDVYEYEPIDQNHPLTKFERVILSPHNGGGTNEAIEAVVKEGCININSILLEGVIANKINIVNLNDLIK
jgi:D-3-phosphoglycerate dehydrogenase